MGTDDGAMFIPDVKFEDGTITVSRGAITYGPSEPFHDDMQYLDRFEHLLDSSGLDAFVHGFTIIGGDIGRVTAYEVLMSLIYATSAVALVMLIVMPDTRSVALAIGTVVCVEVTACGFAQA